MKQIHLRIGALFLLSVALIGFQLSVMRSFSVGSWSNFGSTVISIALLGFGLAGTGLVFIQRWIRRAPNRWLSTSALLFVLSMAAAHVLAQKVPFNPVMIASDRTQLLWIGAYYVIYSVPFFIGAVFISVAFMVMSSRIHALYFWNMTGSGLGGFFILACMYLLPPDYLILPLIFLAFLASLLSYMRFSSAEKRLWIAPRHLAVSVAVAVIAGGIVLGWGKISVSEFKGVSYARKFPDASLDYHSYGPTGEMHVYSSSYFHFAPGLSDVAALNLDRMPENAFKGLYIDGGGPIGIMRKLRGEESRYIEYLPMSAPYLLVDDPRVLIVKLGGGISTFTALHHGAEKVHVVESNPAIIRLLEEVPRFVEYTGGLLQDPRVEVAEGEPRAYCARTEERFDLVEISLIDSVGLSQAGGYPVDANYTYTVEAFSEYMQSLKPEGLLSVTVWNKLSPPRNVPKLLTTVVQSLEQQGVAHPERRVFVFNLLLSTASVLVKNSDFTPAEVRTLREWARRMSFDVSYYPGMPARDKDFERILAGYAGLYGKGRVDGAEAARAPGEGAPSEGASEGGTSQGGAAAEGAPQAGAPAEGAPAEGSRARGAPSLLPDDLYHFSLEWLLSGRKQRLYDQYVFNIRPATDARPYYTAYLKPGNIGYFLDQLGEISEEWGYLLLLATLLVSIAFGILIILIPVVGRWRDLFRGRQGTLGIIVYYACLGMGYMLVEIYLIQRLSYFLGDPIFSVSVVITSMLVLSALGSLYASRFGSRRAFIVRAAVLGVAASLLVYIFALPSLIDNLIALPLGVKLVLALLFIAPSAFFMGMPFPTGLSALESGRGRLLPWALGMNGALSVTGAVAATLVSVSYGFPAVLALAIGLYLIVGLVYRANEAGTKQAAGEVESSA